MGNPVAICLNNKRGGSFARAGTRESDRERWRKEERVTLEVRAPCENYAPGTLDLFRCECMCILPLFLLFLPRIYSFHRTQRYSQCKSLKSCVPLWRCVRCFRKMSNRGINIPILIFGSMASTRAIVACFEARILMHFDASYVNYLCRIRARKVGFIRERVFLMY